MNFVKMHGLGNDFICVDEFKVSSHMDYAETARKLCQRNLGIGADGLLVMLPSEKADARMRIFNADGSEAEMCGNGIRCFAKYMFEAGNVSADSMAVETGNGVKKVYLDVHNGSVRDICVNMGFPIFDPKMIPVRCRDDMAVKQEIEAAGRRFCFTALSMGNPHCVIFREDLENIDLQTWGPLLENHSLFPQRINVEFVQVDNRREITIKVWERGVGLTQACGTGACASVVAGVLEGRLEREVRVNLPGGRLKVAWLDSQEVMMTGPAAYVFKGSLLSE